MVVRALFRPAPRPAMEEVSSFWKNKLSWQVFFCCMVATFTTDLLNSSFHGFKYKNDFGPVDPLLPTIGHSRAYLHHLYRVKASCL